MLIFEKSAAFEISTFWRTFMVWSSTKKTQKISANGVDSGNQGWVRKPSPLYPDMYLPFGSKYTPWSWFQPAYRRLFECGFPADKFMIWFPKPCTFYWQKINKNMKIFVLKTIPEVLYNLWHVVKFTSWITYLSSLLMLLLNYILNMYDILCRYIICRCGCLMS